MLRPTRKALLRGLRDLKGTFSTSEFSILLVENPSAFLPTKMQFGRDATDRKRITGFPGGPFVFANVQDNCSPLLYRSGISPCYGNVSASDSASQLSRRDWPLSLVQTTIQSDTRCDSFVRESVQARTVNSEYICLSSSAPRVHSPLVPGVPFYALPHSVYSFILCVLLHHQFNFNLGLVGDTQHLLLID